MVSSRVPYPSRKSSKLEPMYLEQIKPEQTVVVTAPNGVRSDGKVRDIAAKVDSGTRLGTVYVSLPARSGFRAGMFASVEAMVGGGSAVTIPEQALVWPDGKTSAFVVAEDGSVRLARLTAAAQQPVIQRVDTTGSAILTFAIEAPGMTLEEQSWLVDKGTLWNHLKYR